MAYARLEPWDEERADLRSGILAAMVANALVGKRGRMFKPTDFILRFGDEQRRAKQTPEEMLAIVKQMNALLGGTVRGKPRKIEKKAKRQ